MGRKNWKLSGIGEDASVMKFGSFKNGEVVERVVMELGVLGRVDVGRSLVRLWRKVSSPMAAIYPLSDRRDTDGSCRVMCSGEDGRAVKIV